MFERAMIKTVLLIIIFDQIQVKDEFMLNVQNVMSNTCVINHHQIVHHLFHEQIQEAQL